MARPVKPENAKSHERRREAVEDEMDRRAAAWCQAERIEKYLPVLRAQRDELTILLADEERAMHELRKEAEAERPRRGRIPGAASVPGGTTP